MRCPRGCSTGSSAGTPPAWRKVGPSHSAFPRTSANAARSINFLAGIIKRRDLRCPTSPASAREPTFWNEREGAAIMVTFKSIVAAAAVAIALAFQSGAVSAQTQVSLLGADGYTRAMWRGTDGSISLWKLDLALNFVGSHNYGPYTGWSPVALTM